MALHRLGARDGSKLTGPKRVARRIRKHSEKESTLTFGAGIDKLLGSG